MMGTFGFSCVGAVMLLMLFIPNIFWINRQPAGYTSEGENKVLLIMERAGETAVSVFSLIFTETNIHNFGLHTLWLAAAFVLMLIYEAWWIRYFKSGRSLSDFYSSILGIPLAGATLPVFAFLFLGIYSRIPVQIVSAVILGIGHISIHAGHYNDMKKVSR